MFKFIKKLFFTGLTIISVLSSVNPLSATPLSAARIFFLLVLKHVMQW